MYSIGFLVSVSGFRGFTVLQVRVSGFWFWFRSFTVLDEEEDDHEVYEHEECHLCRLVPPVSGIGAWTHC